jgi:nucleoside-diphosphate-sugar epimerase
MKAPFLHVGEKPVRVLITGGSGFLGLNLVRRLLSDGAADVCSLDTAQFPDAALDRLEAVVGDIRDPATVRGCMRGARSVVHCAAALPLHARAVIRSTEVKGTRVLLEEAARAGVERFIFISSTAVYGIPNRVPVLETDALQGVGPYGEAKIEAERLCADWRARGMCVTVLRPKSFIGPERLGVFSLLYDWALDGRGFPVLGTGRNRYQLLDVNDLCDAIVASLSRPAHEASDVFNIGARDFSSLRNDFQAVLDEAGFGKHVVCLPERPAVLALRVLERLRLSPLYKWVYETAAKESWVSIEKASRVLSFSPRYSNRDALLRNFTWYRKNAEQVRARTGVSHRDSWNQGVLRIAKAFF